VTPFFQFLRRKQFRSHAEPGGNFSAFVRRCVQITLVRNAAHPHSIWKHSSECKGSAMRLSAFWMAGDARCKRGSSCWSPRRIAAHPCSDPPGRGKMPLLALRLHNGPGACFDRWAGLTDSDLHERSSGPTSAPGWARIWLRRHPRHRPAVQRAGWRVKPDLGASAAQPAWFVPSDRKSI